MVTPPIPRKRGTKRAEIALLPSAPPLSPSELSDAARQAAEEILIAGQSENTVRSYRSALRYWCAWSQARYRQPLALPVSVPVVLQFLVDHLARGSADQAKCELPVDIDELLVQSGFKGHIGALKMNTIIHRLAVLSKIHQLRNRPNPCEDAQVRHLLSWYGQLFVDTRVAIMDGKDRGVYEQQSAVHG